jgi:DNA-binding PadR family transcriptional regulator
MDSPLTVRALVILVLDAGPAHGAEIRDRIRQRTGGLVHPGEGAVHSAIASLGRDLLIEEARVEHHVGGGRPRRFWQWTETGRAADLEIRRTLTAMRAVSLDPSPGSDPPPDPVGPLDHNLDKPPAAADLASRSD